MKERIELGSAPWDEDCAQVGQADYYQRAQKECIAYKRQLQRILEAEGYSGLLVYGELRFVIKSNAHDFGNYYEVVVVFDADDEQQVEAAYFIEGNLPAKWDAIALDELGYCQEAKQVSCST